ncbi:hypothetical protein OAD71_03435 [Gammaproteobacteria bacterium]|nr:hypothetical protein [Gammaproteobacteria bacterium]
MKKILLTLMVFGIVGCASTAKTPVEPFLYQKNLDDMQGFHYFKDDEALKSLVGIGNIDLDKADTFKRCMGLPLSTPIYELIGSFSGREDGYRTRGDGCYSIAFSNLGIFVNSGGRYFISYTDLLSPQTAYKIVDTNTLEISVKSGDERFTYTSYQSSALLNIFTNAQNEFIYNPRTYEQGKLSEPTILSENFFHLIEKSGLDILSVTPNISSRKENAFRKCNRIPDNEKLLAYFDFTFFVRTGCEGVAFTNKGFYVKPGKWDAMDFYAPSVPTVGGRVPRISGGRGRWFYSYEDYMMLEFKPRRYGQVEIAPRAFVDPRLEKLFAVLRNGVSTMTDEEILIAAKPRPNQTNLEAAEQILSFILPVYLFSQSFTSSCGLPNRPGSPSTAAPRRVKASYNSRAKKYNKALEACKKNKLISASLLWAWEDIDRVLFQE